MNQARIENRLEVDAYLAQLKYALEHDCKLSFQEDRDVDKRRDIHYTNRFTIADLFPDEDPVEVLKRELKKLRPADSVIGDAFSFPITKDFLKKMKKR